MLSQDCCDSTGTGIGASCAYSGAQLATADASCGISDDCSGSSVIGDGEAAGG